MYLQIVRIMTQQKATAQTSVEYLPGVRRDKRFGNVRIDCYLNMSRPEGGMLPGTGLANYRPPNLAVREDMYLAIKEGNKTVSVSCPAVHV